MSDPKRPPPDSRDEAGATLADLVYADRARTPVAEKDWVALVQAIAAGDQRALNALYERMHRIVFTLIARIIRHPETAEELTLDVFHDVWRRASTYDPAGGTVVGWIMNQARSRALDRLRFENRKKRVNPGTGDEPSAVAATDPHDALAFEEQARLLQSALSILKPDERQAIETAYFSDLTYAEVALRLNQPLGTIKTRIRTGLGKLRELLGPGSKDL